VFILKATQNKWALVNEKGEQILFGKGPHTLGLALCKSYGFTVSKIVKPEQLRKVA